MNLSRVFTRRPPDPVATPRSATAPTPASGRAEAETLAARLPALLTEAEQVAFTVAQGVHGRRRAGSGDSFWQYRQAMPGEPLGRIDWRQSARSTRLFVRETEWEAAQTVCLWRDRSASMGWRSTEGLPQKRQRAELLLLALAILLLRGGEHVRLLSSGAGPAARFANRQAIERLALALLQPEAAAADDGGLPLAAGLPRHGRVVLVGDFLGSAAALAPTLTALAAVPASVSLVQLLDPAELELPYEGRLRFEGLEGEPPHLVPRTQDVRTAYAEALARHQAELAALCGGLGIGLLQHRTDRPASTALLALHQALSRQRRIGLA